MPADGQLDLMSRLRDLRVVQLVPLPAVPRNTSIWGQLGHALRNTGHYVHVRTDRQVDFDDAPSIWLEEWKYADQ